MYYLLVNYLILFPIIAVIITSVSLNSSKCTNIYYCTYFVISIETTSSLMILSIPISTKSFYSTGRFYIASLTK